MTRNLFLAILALYFHVKLNLDTNQATSMFHLYEFVTYAFTIVGAMIADSWLGHYKTIVMMQLMFFIGATIVAVGNIESLHLPIQ